MTDAEILADVLMLHELARIAEQSKAPPPPPVPA